MRQKILLEVFFREVRHTITVAFSHGPLSFANIKKNQEAEWQSYHHSSRYLTRLQRWGVCTCHRGRLVMWSPLVWGRSLCLARRTSSLYRTSSRLDRPTCHHIQIKHTLWVLFWFGSPVLMSHTRQKRNDLTDSGKKFFRYEESYYTWTLLQFVSVSIKAGGQIAQNFK